MDNEHDKQIRFSIEGFIPLDVEFGDTVEDVLDDIRKWLQRTPDFNATVECDVLLPNCCFRLKV